MMDNHYDEVESEVESEVDHSNQCSICNNVYSKKANLNRHLQNVHGISTTTTSPRNTIRCLEESCLFFCKDIATLRKHLIQEHEIDMEVENVRFQSQKGSYVARHAQRKPPTHKFCCQSIDKNFNIRGSGLQLYDYIASYCTLLIHAWIQTCVCYVHTVHSDVS